MNKEDNKKLVDLFFITNLKDIDIDKIMEIYDEIIIEGDKITCKK